MIMRTRILATIAATAAALALSAGPALASPVPPASKATPQCSAVPQCITPDVYTGSDGNAELGLTWDSFLGQNAPLVVDNVTGDNYRQDFQWTRIDTVKELFNEGTAPAWGLNSLDKALYGDDYVYALEATPDGFSSGFCVANISNQLLLRNCSGSKWQAFIVTNDAAGGISPADGQWILSVVHANVTAQHLALNVPFGDEDVTLNFRPVTNNNQVNQDWDYGDAPTGSS